MTRAAISPSRERQSGDADTIAADGRSVDRAFCFSVNQREVGPYRRLLSGLKRFMARRNSR